MSEYWGVGASCRCRNTGLSETVVGVGILECQTCWDTEYWDVGDSFGYLNTVMSELCVSEYWGVGASCVCLNTVISELCVSEYRDVGAVGAGIQRCWWQ